VDALADRLAALLADPARCLAYGLAGRRLVEASYTWDRVGDAMAAVIGEHLASRPGGGAA
jgi:glycosyltransferase involved in cell wall biosynthesis